MSTTDPEHDEWCRTRISRARGAMDAALEMLIGGGESVANADTMIRWSAEFRLLARHGDPPKPKAEVKPKAAVKGWERAAPAVKAKHPGPKP